MGKARTLAATWTSSYAACMEKKQLLESLDALRAEVARSHEVDPKMLAELRKLTDEIRQSSAKPVVAVETPADAPHGLRNLLLRFEADHPELSTSVGKVADALAAMGF
jgi:hypothetical protein